LKEDGMAGRTRIIDLSVPLMNYSMDTHEQTIHYLDHAEVARQRAKTYDIPADRFPVPHVHTASEVVTLTTHAGTHVDAPWHYGPLSEGRPARTIDEIPLEWCYGDGVVLDFTAKHADELISPGDIDAALGRIGHRLQPLDIVLIRTGCDRFLMRERRLR
jgi:kynurenine formamidase